MIESVSYFDRILIGKPGDSLCRQLLQWFFVKSVSNDDSDVWTDFTLKINDSWQAKSEHDLQHQHAAIILISFISMIFRQVTNEEMYKDVEQLCSQYDNNWMIKGMKYVCR